MPQHVSYKLNWTDEEEIQVNMGSWTTGTSIDKRPELPHLEIKPYTIIYPLVNSRKYVEVSRLVVDRASKLAYNILTNS